MKESLSSKYLFINSLSVPPPGNGPVLYLANETSCCGEYTSPPSTYLLIGLSPGSGSPLSISARICCRGVGSGNVSGANNEEKSVLTPDRAALRARLFSSISLNSSRFRPKVFASLAKLLNSKALNPLPCSREK